MKTEIIREKLDVEDQEEEKTAPKLTFGKDIQQKRSN
jgi:hypothetical protein